MIPKTDEERTELSEVKVYQVNLRCAECGEFMRFTGRSKPSIPSLNLHVCPNGHEEWVRDSTYPCRVFKEVA